MSYLLVQEEFTRDNRWILVEPLFHYKSYGAASDKRTEVEKYNAYVLQHYTNSSELMPPPS
jgi:hypothetical protein